MTHRSSEPRLPTWAVSLGGGVVGGLLFWFVDAMFERWADFGSLSDRLFRSRWHRYLQGGLVGVLVALALRLKHLLAARQAVVGDATGSQSTSPSSPPAAASSGEWLLAGLGYTTNEQLRLLARAVEASSSAVLITDRHGNITYVNPKFSELTGFTAAEVLGCNPRLLKSGQMAAEEYSLMWATIASGNEWRGEFHNRRKDGSLYWEFASISPVLDEAGEITHYVAVKEDITARKLAEQALRESEDKYRQLFSRQFDAAVVVDLEANQLVEANDAFLQLFGVPQDDLQALNPSDLWADEPPAFVPAVSDTTCTEVWCRRQDGSTFPAELASGTFSWQSRTFACYILRNITDRVLRQRSLELLSTTDGLTGLANWRAFQERLASEWQRALRSRSCLAVIMLDLDSFKAFNDRCGHLAGDECLRRVARAVAGVARRTSDLVARWGGEEFAVVLPATHLEGAVAVAHAMRQAVLDLAIPHPASLVAPVVTASFGVAALIPAEGTDKEQLMAAADAALYAAKRRGRNQVCAAQKELADQLTPEDNPAPPPSSA